MASGTPVVAYDTFGAREIVQSEVDGMLTAHTPEALAEALGDLVGDGEKRARLSAAATRNAERYSLETTGRQMLAVYEQAMAAMRDASPS